MNTNILENADIKQSLNSYASYDYAVAYNQIQEILNKAVELRDKKRVAICLALKSLYSYYAKKIPFLTLMNDLENANFLANTINDYEVQDVVNFVYAQILFAENDIDYVVNFAAESHVDNSIKHPEIFIETNLFTKLFFSLLIKIGSDLMLFTVIFIVGFNSSKYFDTTIELNSPRTLCKFVDNLQIVGPPMSKTHPLGKNLKLDPLDVKSVYVIPS